MGLREGERKRNKWLRDFGKKTETFHGGYKVILLCCVSFIPFIYFPTISCVKLSKALWKGFDFGANLQVLDLQPSSEPEIGYS